MGVYDTYITGTHSRTVTLIIDVTSGNEVASIGSLLLRWGFCNYQISFNPSIPKDNTKQLTLSFTATWGRV